MSPHWYPQIHIWNVENEEELKNNRSFEWTKPISYFSCKKKYNRRETERWPQRTNDVVILRRFFFFLKQGILKIKMENGKWSWRWSHQRKRKHIYHWKNFKKKKHKNYKQSVHSSNGQKVGKKNSFVIAVRERWKPKGKEIKNFIFINQVVIVNFFHFYVLFFATFSPIKSFLLFFLVYSSLNYLL